MCLAVIRERTVRTAASGSPFVILETYLAAWRPCRWSGFFSTSAEGENIVDAAGKVSNASDIAFTGMHQQVIYAVSIAYYAYVAAVERHQTAIEALTNTKEIEVAAQARFNHGEGTSIENAQARGLTAQAQFSLVNAQGPNSKLTRRCLRQWGCRRWRNSGSRL